MDSDRIQAWKAELVRDRESLVFISLVDALRRMRQFDEARRYALQGLERHPHLAGAHDALARVMADLGDEEPHRTRQALEPKGSLLVGDREPPNERWVAGGDLDFGGRHGKALGVPDRAGEGVLPRRAGRPGRRLGRTGR
jgi:hypothetical protein